MDTGGVFSIGSGADDTPLTTATYRHLQSKFSRKLATLIGLSFFISGIRTSTYCLPFVFYTNNMAEFKNFDSSVLEGHIKFREKKTVSRYLRI